MEKNNEHDIKQLKFMFNQLEFFEKKQIQLNTLIGNLETLLSTLQSVDSDWEDQFFKEWSDLEMVNVSIIIAEANGKIMDPIMQNNVEIEMKNSICKLKNLIVNFLKKYFENPDSSINKIATVLDKEWVMCGECFEAWQPSIKDAMLTCPKCDIILHNPHFKPKNVCKN